MAKGTLIKIYSDLNKNEIILVCGHRLYGNPKTILLKQKLHLRICNTCKQSGIVVKDEKDLTRGGVILSSVKPFQIQQKERFKIIDQCKNTLAIEK